MAGEWAPPNPDDGWVELADEHWIRRNELGQIVEVSLSPARARIMSNLTKDRKLAKQRDEIQEAIPLLLEKLNVPEAMIPALKPALESLLVTAFGGGANSIRAIETYLGLVGERSTVSPPRFPDEPCKVCGRTDKSPEIHLNPEVELWLGVVQEAKPDLSDLNSELAEELIGLWRKHH